MSRKRRKPARADKPQPSSAADARRDTQSSPGAPASGQGDSRHATPEASPGAPPAESEADSHSDAHQITADTTMEAIAQTPVYVVASAITDTRAIERALSAAELRYTIDRMGMGDAEARQLYGELKADAQWPTLPLIYVDGEPIGGEPELMALLGRRRMPRAAKWLGAAGLLPFAAGALGAHLDTGTVGPHILQSMLAYAGTILAFMAGCQWGGVVNRPPAIAGRAGRVQLDQPGWQWLIYGIAVLPALLCVWPAWSAGDFTSGQVLWLLGAGFAWVYLADLAWWLLGGWPRWYLELRSWLTAGVLLSLIVAGASL